MCIECIHYYSVARFSDSHYSIKQSRIYAQTLSTNPLNICYMGLRIRVTCQTANEENICLQTGKVNACNLFLMSALHKNVKRE